MAVEIKRLEDTSFSYGDVVDLMHLAFKERKDEGLLFTCVSMTEDEYREKVKDGIVFVAYDSESGRLLGTAATSQLKNTNGLLYGVNELLAIHPDARRMGLASALLKARIDYHKNAGSDCIMSDTAVGAKSSVKYHLKNGFRIIGLFSYPNTNYYSYLFRLQLSSPSKWNSPIYCKCNFIKSFLVITLKYKKNGQKRWPFSLFS